MCRLFAVHASTPVRVDSAFERLKAQAIEHKDGWGVALFDNDGARIETSMESAAACPRFAHLGREIETTRLMAHLRLASVGQVSPENTHPFQRGNFVFMHNGTVRAFELTKHLLLSEISDAQQALLSGETDSEMCFAHWVSQVERLEAPTTAQLLDALIHTIRRVQLIFDNVTLAAQSKPSPPSALNFIISDGRRLVASCLGRTLFFAKSHQAHYLASEPVIDGLQWTPFGEGQLCTIDEHGHLELRGL
jgi:predicted glutamine amidotransferase